MVSYVGDENTDRIFVRALGGADAERFARRTLARADRTHRAIGLYASRRARVRSDDGAYQWLRLLRRQALSRTRRLCSLHALCSDHFEQRT